MKLDKIFDYATVIVGTLIIAIIFNVVFFPLEIIISGSSGLSIIINNFIYIHPSIIILVSFGIALSLGYFFLNKEIVIRSILGSLMYSFWVYVTTPLNTLITDFSLKQEDYLAVVVFASVISGATYGIIYKTGNNISGSDILSVLANKFFGITVGTSGLILTGSIVFMGGFFLDWINVLYGVLALFIIGLVCDKVLLGISFSKAFYIITTKNEEVKNYIINEFKTTITELDAIGGYTNEERPIIMCVVPNRDFFKLREAVRLIDEKVFFVVMDAYEIDEFRNFKK